MALEELKDPTEYARRGQIGRSVSSMILGIAVVVAALSSMILADGSFFYRMGQGLIYAGLLGIAGGFILRVAFRLLDRRH